MSTMKKLFALVLALAMMMSVAVFANAYGDAEAIAEECKYAVDLLSAIGLVEGDNHGNFNPENTITRAEAAAIIYRLRNNGVDDKAAMWVDSEPFTDVADTDWFAGYVAWCYNYGIIDGTSATTFNPKSPIKGIELAKMLLTTAGYKSASEGYTGDAWEKNVLEDASAAGLFANYGIGYSKPCARQWAALMIVNALAAEEAQYLGDYRLPLGDGAKIGAKYLGLAYETTIVIANDEFSIDYWTDAKGTKQGGVAKADKDTIKVSTKTTSNTDSTVKVVKADLPIEMVGQQVVIAYKATYDDKGENKGIENAEKIYGIVATGKTQQGELVVSRSGANTTENPWKYTFTMNGKVYVKDNSDLGSSTKLANANGGQGFDDFMFYGVNMNGQGSYQKITLNINLFATTGASDTQALYRGADMPIYAYDFDGDGDLDRIMATMTMYGRVAAGYDAEKDKTISVNYTVDYNETNDVTDTPATVEYTKENIEINGTVKAGSVVKVQWIDQKIVISPVAANTGILEVHNDNSSDRLTIDGTVYAWAQNNKSFGAYAMLYNNNNSMTEDYQKELLGKKVVFYLSATNRLIEVPTLWEEEGETPDEVQDPDTIDTSKLAYIIDATSYTVTTETADEWAGTKVETKTYNKIKYMTADGETKIETYVDVTADATKANYLTFADLTKVVTENGVDKTVLEDNIAGTVVEVATNGAGVVFKKQLSKANKVIYGAGTAAGAVDAIGLTNKVKYTYENGRFGNVLTDDNTLVFVQYTKKTGNNTEVVYKTMKISEFKDQVNGEEFNVIARDTDLISTALVATIAFGDKDLPGETEEQGDPTAYLIYVTGNSVNTTYGKDSDGNAIQVSKFDAIDLNTGVAGVYYVLGINKTVTVGDILSGTFDENGYIAALPTAQTFTTFDGTLANSTWYVGTLKATAGDILLVGESLLDSKNFASGVKVYAAETTNGALEKCSMADLEVVAKDQSNNFVVRTNSSGKIDMVMFTADGKAF